MRWSNLPRWRRVFALLPVDVGHVTVWLEWYWEYGYSGSRAQEVSMTEPDNVWSRGSTAR